MTSKACDSRERKELYLCPLPDQGNFVVTMVDPVSASGPAALATASAPAPSLLVRFRETLVPDGCSTAALRAGCLVDATKPDSEFGLEKWLELNREHAQKWANITDKKDMAKDAKAH